MMSNESEIQSPKEQSIYTFAGMEFMLVPAGEFLMGSNSHSDEKPQHKLLIPYDYFIGRFPVTWEEYSSFGAAFRAGRSFDVPNGKQKHPVVKVLWKDTQEFVRWLNQTAGSDLPSGHIFRLPSEAEWEKAARGTDGREFPWGNGFDDKNCNTKEGGANDTSPVGKYSPAGNSPYGAADMAGNVYEWTRSLYKPYPYLADDGREDPDESGDRVPRGGSWYDHLSGARAAYRFYCYYPKNWQDLVGFRVVISPILP